MGLIVLSVPNTHPPTVITAYWTAEAKSHYGQMIDRFEQRLRVDKERRDKNVARAKKSQKPKNSGFKATGARNTSVDSDAEDMDDLDY